METFISVDWGTSVLRIRIIDANKKSIITELINPMGIASAFDLWKQSKQPASERISFYQKILLEEIKKLEQKTNVPIQHLPIIISGMASSNIGMKNLSYKEIPFSTDGHDLNVEIIEANNNCSHTMLLISGVRTANDVMRGEETQLIGSINITGEEEHLYIFPGTHSKHAIIKNDEVKDIKTYMTGELFELLSKKSILSNSIEKVADLNDANNLKIFEKGVADSLHLNILNSFFQVRINDLFNKLSKPENYCYLSGLLIGTELKELNPGIHCTVTGDESINTFYQAALEKMKIANVICINSGKATVAGHCLFFDSYKNKLAATGIRTGR
ncbi:MAG: 2-dehydro-3-deoxygalactonokinase [Ginsengibacter sp.]